MRAISGLVLVKETGAGIPNLLVAAYDLERGGPESSREASPQSILEFGKRIGSVLTDKEGRFLLASGELEFQGNEARPDLSIVVFAPEDVQRLDEPYPLPGARRVLYASAMPRADAGAQEAFVIRLLQTQLDEFHISTGIASGQGSYDNDRLVQMVASSWNLHDALHERLTQRVQDNQAKTVKFRQMALDKVTKLSGIPLHLRGDGIRNNDLLIEDRRALAAELGRKQRAATNEGLKRLADAPPSVRLVVTSADLADLGLKEVDGELDGEVDSAKLATKIRALTKGVDLVRIRGIDNPSPEELERKYLMSPSAPTPTPSKPDTGA